MIPPPAILDDQLWFPDPNTAGTDGLVAIGGDLSVPRLLLAYRSGVFPWTAHPITWWSPDPRAVIEIPTFHVSRSFARFLKQHTYAITRNKAFREVMIGCTEHRKDGNWISRDFIDAYSNLFRFGHAHSIEVWDGNQLVGGIYGVAVGALFSGESMFHRKSNTSKLALYQLIHHLHHRGFKLLDIQMLTPITRQLGAVLIPRSVYLNRLDRILQDNPLF